MRITELPQAASVAQTDDLAIDVPGGKTYRVPRSILAPAPYIATIPTGQWSGSGSDRYITVTASNLTENAMLYPFYDNASAALLNGPVWVIPAAGSFTIHTSAIPSGTVTISVLLAGIVGEAQYQVLADVYSKSQVDSIVAQSTAIESGNLTKVHANITSVETAFYRKSGKTVEVYVSFTVGSAISDNTATLFSGLPEVASYTRYALLSVGTTPTRIRVGINSTNIVNAYTANGIPAGTYEGTIVYLAK